MKDYRTSHLVKYEHPEYTSRTSVECLAFLKGTEWNQGALNYVHALRPSSIRVVEGRQTMDSSAWRVTVLVEGNKIIRIDQEVEVGCVGFENADEMDQYYTKD